MGDTRLEPLEVDMNVSDFTLTGRIDALYPERFLEYRYARIRSRDHLKVWIYHLVLNVLKIDHYPLTSLLVGLRDKGGERVWDGVEFCPLENAEMILDELLKIYWKGLIKPLHFFPESSWEYAKMRVARNKSEEDALGRARNVWTGSEYNRGEREDAYYQLCFENSDPLDYEFQRNSEEIFEMLLKHQNEIVK